MNRFIGILGIFAILGIAYLLSNNKKSIDMPSNCAKRRRLGCQY